MERRVLSWAEGVMGMVWQELEGMVEMDGMDGMDGFRAKIQLFSDTAKFGV